VPANFNSRFVELDPDFLSTLIGPQRHSNIYGNIRNISEHLIFQVKEKRRRKRRRITKKKAEHPINLLDAVGLSGL